MVIQPLSLFLNTGNLATASPISDVNPLLGACGAHSHTQLLCTVPSIWSSDCSRAIKSTSYTLSQYTNGHAYNDVVCSSTTGNLATASPISDMNPLLGACGADVILASTEGARRSVKVRDFFLGQVGVTICNCRRHDLFGFG